jgi:hypothetical protein
MKFSVMLVKVSCTEYFQGGNMESGLSLQTRRALLQQVILLYQQATAVKKKSKLLDITTRHDRVQSNVRHVAA